MANDITPPPIHTGQPLNDEAALQAAYAQAVAELARAQQQASVVDHQTSSNMHYSMHDVTGIGRYVVPKQMGWIPLLHIIHDPVPNIDFSCKIYPAFDNIIGDHFQSPYLLDPIDDHYESYESLRDNLAAVRNFIYQSYYANTPAGMTPEKAKKSLADIAAFVGDGLYNNWSFLHLIPNYNPTKPHIDLAQAREPDGKGAQYIYEKILEMQRHSSWLHPLDAIAQLFGGQPSTDWQLPPAETTHFTEELGHELADEAAAATISAAAATSQTALAAAQQRVATIKAQLDALHNRRALNNLAVDLDALGNHLIYTAQNTEAVAQMNDGDRRQAVIIAKNILEKLKLSLGNANILDGLRLRPTDDMRVFGEVKGVAMIYERLMAWARGNNDNGVFQHPAVLAATQSIGQLGYMAKLEALRMANAAGNTRMAASIGEQIKRLPSSFTRFSDTTLGGLLDKISHGIDTILNYVQQVTVSGSSVGFSVDKRAESLMSAPPTAGMANQVGADNAAQRNAQAAMADNFAAQMQAQIVINKNALQAKAQAPQQGQQQPQAAPPRTGSMMGRQSLQAARTQQNKASTTPANATPAPPKAPLNPADMQAQQRAVAAQAMAQAQRDRDKLQQQEQQDIARRQAAAAMKSKIKSLGTGIDLKGMKATMNTQGLTTQTITGKPQIRPQDIRASMKPAPTPQQPAQGQQAQRIGAIKPPTPVAPPSTQSPITPSPVTLENDPLKQHPYAAQQPPIPGGGRGNGGRGF